jgi:hypothetical protein
VPKRQDKCQSQQMRAPKAARGDDGGTMRRQWHEEKTAARRRRLSKRGCQFQSAMAHSPAFPPFPAAFFLLAFPHFSPGLTFHKKCQVPSPKCQPNKQSNHPSTYTNWLGPKAQTALFRQRGTAARARPSSARFLVTMALFSARHFPGNFLPPQLFTRFQMWTPANFDSSAPKKFVASPKKFVASPKKFVNDGSSGDLDAAAQFSAKRQNNSSPHVHTSTCPFLHTSTPAGSTPRFRW